MKAINPFIIVLHCSHLCNFGAPDFPLVWRITMCFIQCTRWSSFPIINIWDSRESFTQSWSVHSLFWKLRAWRMRHLLTNQAAITFVGCILVGLSGQSKKSWTSGTTQYNSNVITNFFLYLCVAILHSQYNVSIHDNIDEMNSITNGLFLIFSGKEPISLLWMLTGTQHLSVLNFS